MHLNVVTTLRCNLRCAYCVYGCPQEVDLDPESFRETMEGLLEHGLSSVTFTGGEPILHPSIAGLVDSVARRGLGFGFVSNGWHHEGYAEILTLHPGLPREVAVSLDGVSGTHDHVRGAGSFRRVVAALRRFAGMGVTTSVNFMLTEANRHELGPVVGLSASLGASAVKVAAILPTAPGESWRLASDSRRLIREEADTASRRYGIPVNVANSVHNPVTVEFCPVLTHDVVTLDPYGYLSFCCDVPGAGARLGRPGDGMERALARRRHLTDTLLLQRILAARDGSLGPDDQSCSYCLKHFGALA